MENRVIAHFDIDCFYAQSEELRDPSLRGRPVGVTQKFLVVTSNYVARSLGVRKMSPIAEAKRKLPSLVLVNGEDLTPYRAESKQIDAVLKRFGTVERHGLDEGAVDITAQVEARLRSGPPSLSFSGHVLGLKTPLKTSDGLQSDTLCDFESMQLNLETLPRVDVLLLVGSQVVSEIRAAIERETGFRCSCGVAQNKMLAKLSSSLNKPNMQTCLLQGAVAEFLSPMSVRRIGGVGGQTHKVLTGMNVETIADLGKIDLKQLSERLGDRIALLLFNAAKGQDPSPVLDKGPPKSISVEDSFRNCPTMQHAVEILRVLAPDLVRRLDEDREETGRLPKSFTVKWRIQGSRWNFISVSTQMPPSLLIPSTSVEKRAALAVEVATRLLLHKLQEPFNLAVLNIGATNFESSSAAPGVGDIRSFLQGNGKAADREIKVISKRDARIKQESVRAMTNKSRGVTSERQFLEDKHFLGDMDHLSDNSDDEESDDLADQLALVGRQSSLMPRNSSEFAQGQVSHRQETKFFNRLATSGVYPCAALSESSEKLQEWVSYRETKDADSAVLRTPTEQSFSPSEAANEQQMRHHQTPGAAPSSRKLLEANSPASPAGVAHQSSALANPAERDNKDLASSDSGNHSKSLHISESRLNLSSAPNAMCTTVTSNLRDHPGSSVEGPGRDERICEECGDMVGNTDSGRQEHADYHFALSLGMQERRSVPQSPDSSRVPSRAKRERVLRAASPLKKSKLRNGTLDAFVVRRQ